MKIVYVDETGDPAGNPSMGGSREFAIGAVVIDSSAWNVALDELIALRRDIRSRLGVPMTEEIKASHLVRNEGWFRHKGLRPSLREQIFRDHLRKLEAIGAQCFTVWVDKSGTTALIDVKRKAWDMLFQRLQKTFPTDPILLVHDDGDAKYIRGHARRVRRHLTAGLVSGGSTALPVSLLLEDPVARDSKHSYFVQCADLVAYAAAKSMIPGGSRANRVCPPRMWGNLGASCLAVVNYYARRSDPTLAPGIAVQR